MYIFAFLLLLSISQTSIAQEGNACLEPITTVTAVYEKWDSEEGIARLQSSEAKENFWRLIRFYESQMRRTYCGIAASVIALNALSIKPKESQFFGKYRMFTQEEFFSENVCSHVDCKQVKERGISLNGLASVLKAIPVNISVYEAETLSDEEIRDSLIAALKNPQQCVLALYDRKQLNQTGAGHWSPIAAYDQESDSFLILDVAKFKYPPHWVDAQTFIESMRTTDPGGISRGFIVIDSNNLN